MDIMLEQTIAYTIGEVIGASIGIFILGKIIEFILLKRFIRQFSRMAWASSALVFIGLAILVILNPQNPQNPAKVNLVVFFIASIALPPFRIVIKRRRSS